MSFCDNNSLISISRTLIFRLQHRIIQNYSLSYSSLEQPWIQDRDDWHTKCYRRRRITEEAVFLCHSFYMHVIWCYTEKMRKMLRGILLMRQSSELTPYHDTKRRSNEHKWQTEETKLSSLFQEDLSKKNLLEVKERRLKTEYSIASFPSTESDVIECNWLWNDLPSNSYKIAMRIMSQS